MRAPAIWFVGTVYVLAALTGMAAVVWAADHEDNSADPTHWGVGAVVVLAPLLVFWVWQVCGTRIRSRLAGRRSPIVAGVVLALAAGGALVFGAQQVIADASVCDDDDCVRVVVPIGIACVLGAWSLPLGLSTMRRVRYPVPLMSAGLVAVSVTLVAGLAAVVQLTRQEDDFADLALAVVVLVWVLPAVLALVAMVPLRNPMGAVAHRPAAGRTAALYLIGVGSWFIAMPFAAGVDHDSLPVLLAVAGGPGLVLVVVGLGALVTRLRAGG